MPIKRTSNQTSKEIKAYTLKRLLKRRLKYKGTGKEPEEYIKIERIFFGKNFNPFKILERGVVSSSDVETAINELEASGLIKIDSENRLFLTDKGQYAAEEIYNAQILADIDEKIFGDSSEQAKNSQDLKIEEPEKKVVQPPSSYICPDCGHEITNPKHFCPRCGLDIDVQNLVKCDQCGNVNDSGSAFCVKCGKKMA